MGKNFEMEPLMPKQTQKIVIVGGGSAGWMTAAALSRYLHSPNHEITLVESESISTIGVGEATIPYIHNFNELLGVSEKDFMKATSATFKLGIKFVDWTALGHSYFHAFGHIGFSLHGVDFHHMWKRAQGQGMTVNYGDFSLASALAAEGKFGLPSRDPHSIFAFTDHAYHIDANLYAAFLRQYAEEKGVTRIEGKVVQVDLAPESGDIDKVVLESGESIEGDFFIDCSGFRALLIEGALEAGHEDWSHLLPMDRAVVVPTQSKGSATPYTITTARKAGWTWRIPLQHRVGNGHVYSSRYMNDDEAHKILMQSIDADPLTDPRILSFKTGHRKTFWKGNCVAIGLSAGFIEPLESTALHLIHYAITKLISFFPNTGSTPETRSEFNRIMSASYAEIRDFIILHYWATKRDDTEFWRDMQNLTLPDSLQARMNLIRRDGYMMRTVENVFAKENWLSVSIGQGVGPEGYNPIADGLDYNNLIQRMGYWRQSIKKGVAAAPRHEDFLKAFLT